MKIRVSLMDSLPSHVPRLAATPVGPVTLLALVGTSDTIPQMVQSAGGDPLDWLNPQCPAFRMTEPSAAIRVAMLALVNGLAESAAVFISRPDELGLSRLKRMLQEAPRGQVLVSFAAQDLSRDELVGVFFEEFGVCDLGDRTERLFTVIIDRRASNRHPIPTDRGRFVGRREELRDLGVLVEQNRLVTIHGGPGIGKSALIERFVAEGSDDAADPATFLDLALIPSSNMLLATINRELGVTSRLGQPAHEALVEALKDRQLLLIFDHAEHHWREARTVVQMIYAQCPNMSILVGSQRTLRLAGEMRYELKGLSCPSPAEDWRAMIEYDAIALFSDRASSSSGAYNLEEAAPYIAELCHRLDGIPLAIELAAAKAHVMSPKLLASRAGELVANSPGGSRQSPSRAHGSTLAVAINLAHELLPSYSKVLLRRMSIFNGAFSVDWAADVCAFDTDLPRSAVLEAFEQLVDCSFLMRSRNRGLEHWFYLSRTMQSYASKNLSAKEASLLTIQRNDHSASLAAGAESGLNSSDSPHWFAMLEAAYEDIERLIVDGCGLYGDLEQSIRILFQIFPFLYTRGYHQETRRLCDRLMADPAARKSVNYSRLLNAAAISSGELGDENGRRTYALRSLRIARRVGDKDKQGCAWSTLAASHEHRSRMHRARTCVNRALRLFREAPSEARIGQMLVNLAATEIELGDFVAAEVHVQEALERMDGGAAPEAVAFAYVTFAHLELSRDRPDKALEQCARAFCAFGWHYDSQIAVLALRNFAYALRDSGFSMEAAAFVGVAEQRMAGVTCEFSEANGMRWHRLREDLLDELGARAFEERSDAGRSWNDQDIRSSIERSPAS